MARSSECTEQYAQKVFDSADILRDAMFHQSPLVVRPFGLASTPVVHDIRRVVVVRVAPFGYSDPLIILGDTATAVSPSDLPGVVRFKAAEVEKRAYDVLASCVLRR